MEWGAGMSSDLLRNSLPNIVVPSMVVVSILLVGYLFSNFYSSCESTTTLMIHEAVLAVSLKTMVLIKK